MTMVEEMRALTDSLARSCEERFQETTARRQAITQKLTLFGSERVREEASLRRALSKDAAVRNRTVASMLEGFGRERAVAAGRQRTLLKSETTRNRAQVSRLLENFHGGRVELAGTQSEMARIWRNFAVRRAEAGSRKVSAQQPPAALEGQVFSFLASHPNGVKFRDIERAFHASRASVAYAMEALIEQNRGRKDEARDIYFAT